MTAPGPLGEEARLLVEAARDWAARVLPDGDGHGADCSWCPVCRTAAALRTPEVSAALATAVTAAAGALATFLDTLATPPAPDAGPTAEPAPAPVPEPAPQHIPMDGD